MKVGLLLSEGVDSTNVNAVNVGVLRTFVAIAAAQDPVGCKLILSSNGDAAAQTARVGSGAVVEAIYRYVGVVAHGIAEHQGFSIDGSSGRHHVRGAAAHHHAQVFHAVGLDTSCAIVGLGVVLSTCKRIQVGALCVGIAVGDTGVQLNVLLKPVAAQGVVLGGGAACRSAPINEKSALAAHFPLCGAAVEGGMPAFLVYARG